MVKVRRVVRQVKFVSIYILFLRVKLLTELYQTVNIQGIRGMLMVPLFSLLMTVCCLMITEEIRSWKRKEKASSRSITWLRLTQKVSQTTFKKLLECQKIWNPLQKLFRSSSRTLPQLDFFLSK